MNEHKKREANKPSVGDGEIIRKTQTMSRKGLRIFMRKLVALKGKSITENEIMTA